jgi:hypothetical protein
MAAEMMADMGPELKSRKRGFLTTDYTDCLKNRKTSGWGGKEKPMVGDRHDGKVTG